MDPAATFRWSAIPVSLSHRGQTAARVRRPQLKHVPALSSANFTLDT
jgi:hypothetical protein